MYILCRVASLSCHSSRTHVFACACVCIILCPHALPVFTRIRIVFRFFASSVSFYFSSSPLLMCARVSSLCDVGTPSSVFSGTGRMACCSTIMSTGMALRVVVRGALGACLSCISLPSLKGFHVFCVRSEHTMFRFDSEALFTYSILFYLISCVLILLSTW